MSRSPREKEKKGWCLCLTRQFVCRPGKEDYTARSDRYCSDLQHGRRKSSSEFTVSRGVTASKLRLRDGNSYKLRHLSRRCRGFHLQREYVMIQSGPTHTTSSTRLAYRDLGTRSYARVNVVQDAFQHGTFSFRQNWSWWTQ